MIVKMSTITTIAVDMITIVDELNKFGTAFATKSELDRLFSSQCA